MRAIVSLTLLHLLGAAAVAGPARYLITVPSAGPDHVEVEARFTLTGDTIGMYIVSSADLPNGSADLVEGLEVRDDAGPRAVENLGDGDWRIEGGRAGEEVTVRYRVVLDHGDHPWGPGIDEVAYTTDDGVFFAGRAIFVIPFDGLADGVEIHFDLPDGWKASHPWTRNDGVAHASAQTLIRNCFFLGAHLEETVRLDDFTFVLAMGNDLAAQRDLIVDTMRPVLPSAKATFGGMPDQSRYLVVINRYPRTDGGAYEGSYSMVVDGIVDHASSALWGHLVVHEVLHFWNGHTLRRASAREEWFNEGVTDYLTVRMRARLGQDPREVTLRKLENALRRVALSRIMMGSALGIDEAGREKQRNRFLVYGGGLLAGLALDVELRRATDGARSLDDLLQRLFDDHARAGRPYTVADVQAAATSLAGRDLDATFQEFVFNGELPDYDLILNALGLRQVSMIDEVFLVSAPDAGGEGLWKDVFGSGADG